MRSPATAASAAPLLRAVPSNLSQWVRSCPKFGQADAFEPNPGVIIL